MPPKIENFSKLWINSESQYDQFAVAVGPMCLWYLINSLHKTFMEIVKCKTIYRSEVWAWFVSESYLVKFFIRKTETRFHKPLLAVQATFLQCWNKLIWGKRICENSFLQKFGCDICLFSSRSLYIFTLLMNECLIATEKLSGVTSQQNLLPRPAGILLMLCSWLMEVAGVQHK